MSLKHLFKKNEGGQVVSHALPVGARIPLDISAYAVNKDEPVILVFISLHCMSCIDMLPDLKEFQEQLPYPFVLICNGEQDDIAEIREHFGFEFPFIGKNEEELVHQFQIRHTPYLYVAASDGSILQSTSVNSIADLYRLTMEL